MKVKIPFRARWEIDLIQGNKTMTTRTKPYGKAGDTFEAFGHEFVIIGVLRTRLVLVAERYFREEGCASSEEFKKVWGSLHPRKGYCPDQFVYLHIFRRVSERPTSLPSVPLLVREGKPPRPKKRKKGTPR